VPAAEFEKLLRQNHGLPVNDNVAAFGRTHPTAR
jgi:hypothetical protein